MALERWKIAQEAERKCWSDSSGALRDSDGWMDFIKSNFGLDSRFFEQKTVLEVGCGPCGVIHFINCSEGVRVGIEPRPYLNAWNILSIQIPHILAVGEFLSVQSNKADIVICFNVLDHVLDPRKLLNEVARVLEEDGKLLLWVTIVRDFLKGVSVCLNKIDKPHPYHFTLRDVLDLLQENGLEVTRVFEQRIQKGNIFSSFIRSLLRGKFKVTVANFLASNLYIIAEKG
jgi:SAM-dependent methyltransferase